MIWFDLDDTLWDMEGNSKITLGEIYRSEKLFELYPTEAAWIDIYESINKRLWSQYNEGKVTESYLRVERFAAPLRLAGITGHEAEIEGRRLDPLYLDMLGKQKKLVPGAKHLLEELSSVGHRLGIISNGFREVQYSKLKSSEIEEFFSTIVLSDEAGYPKPDVRIFRYAEEKAGVSRQNCIMVGDSIQTDISGALQASWACIRYNPKGKDNQRGCGEDLIEISHLRRLPKVLKEKFGGKF